MVCEILGCRKTTAQLGGLLYFYKERRRAVKLIRIAVENAIYMALLMMWK